jgi:hypothetical protein
LDFFIEFIKGLHRGFSANIRNTIAGMASLGALLTVLGVRGLGWALGWDDSADTVHSIKNIVDEIFSQLT